MRDTCKVTKQAKFNHKLKEILSCRQLYIILLPTLLFYAIFCYAPISGTIIAFQRYSITRGIWNSEWVGLKNFTEFFNDYNFWRLLRNTLSINGLNLLFGFPAPIILAILLNEIKNLRFKKTVQTITYLPHFLSTVVVASMVLTFFSSDGFINYVRVLMGLKRINFMIMPQYFYGVFISSGIWQQLGWDSIIYIAALASIDQQLYEAARIDGAGRFKQIVHVTLPGITPTIIIILILNIGSMLSVGYEKVLLLYNSAIYETADVISTYVYRRGLLEGNYSYSTAVGLFNSVINFILLMSANTISKRVSGNGLW